MGENFDKVKNGYECIYEFFYSPPCAWYPKKIIEEINDELSIIEHNKRLIEIFEKKIKDKIAEVLGE